ncbi:SDR family NAD(P)-dependent oxidoreductase [Dactylosporangium sp. NPDC051541]|uniref:SDR family NAD(P)-dependent oxidoreductase n=1 Tax=Dactylosporangium sp. NPDC051541 TaxID=3363977 RepID=UPI0037AD691B
MTTTADAFAVIGLSCRLPGAGDPAAFWRLLASGTSAVTPTPEGRWAQPGTADAPLGARHGGFLDRIDGFDHDFFGISPREAAAMDPQQRLVLELSWEAWEDAGIRPETLRDSATGVFIGAIWDDYASLSYRAGPDAFTPHTLTGINRGILANRVSYTYGLHGPSLAVDSAQSSSLVAVHLACESLRRGEAGLALAGGVNLNIVPESTAGAVRFGGLSPDGQCFTFDARANGYVRGEGGGLVVLKPLAAAVADGDRIYCVIQGSAVNNDGATDGLTVPSAAAQAEVIRLAQRDGAARPGDVQYVELHGTGTRLGDPIEAAALGAAIGTAAARDAALLVGSAKTNVGHLEGAAGIVGLLKVALSVRHRQLPPSLNFATPNPDIDFAALNIEVNTGLRDWPDPSRPLLAGVSSFGMGGTNCHVVVSSPPAPAPAPTTAAADGPVSLVLTGRTPKALEEQADRLAGWLAANPGTDPAAVRAALARRTRFPHRAAVTGAGGELLDGVRALAAGRQHPLVTRNGGPVAGRLAFLFSGQGGQYPGMADELYRTEPSFAAAFDEARAELDRHLPRPLAEAIAGEEVNGTLYTQPALFAVQVGLHAALAAHGIHAGAYAGHSLGELTAAHLAGVWSLPDAALLVTTRARLMNTMRAGAMLAVQAGEDETRAALADLPEVAIAALNTADSTVVSGDAADLDVVQAHFRALGRKTKRLNLTLAGHSAHTDPILEEYRAVAATLTYHEPRVPIVSNLTGRPAEPGQLANPDYWTAHMRRPVRFHDAVTALQSEPTAFLELGPDATLTPLIDGSVAIPTQQRSRPQALTLAKALAAVATHTDIEVTWPAAGRVDDLPTYPFQRSRHWLTVRSAAAAVDAPLDAPVDVVVDAVADAPVADALDVADLVRTTVAVVAGQASPEAIEMDRSFKDLGFDSLMTVELRDRLNVATGLALTSALFYSHPTPEALIARLQSSSTDVAGGVTRSVASAAAADEPIAIVGMACRYPGGVGSPDELWRLVADGTDAIGPLPANRGWDLERLYHPDPDHPGTTYARGGGFLADAGAFDAGFFGISPREALAMDPQQRLLLETAWEAMERAALDAAALHGSRTGVFVGATAQDYGPRLHEASTGVDGHLLTGNAVSVASGRIAYTFGFEGPALSIDTACSSSLVAMHLAAQALRRGECNLALAGGVTVMATPGMLVEFSRQRGLATDDRCKPFAAAADGTAWSEGAGMLVLERLSDAQANGHTVLAVIPGSAINQDGASNGLSAPNGLAQERVILQALSSAGLSPADVDAVEAHGTGTTLGDPIEAQALANTYGRDRQTQPLLLGSIKSNIGHTQAAAGVAGVIKMVQAMRHGTLPQTLHVDAPSPHLDWDSSGLQLLTEATLWPAVDRPRRAAVSSFGISGTNAHIILEQAPAPVAAPPAPGLEVHDLPILWRLSAKTPEALRELARRLPLDANPHEVAATLATRTAHPYRASIIGDDRHAALHALATGEEHPNLVYDGQAAPSNPGKTVLVLPGQGSQWPGMARDLYRTTPLIRDHLHACAEALKPHTGWDLIELLQQDEIPQTPDVIQPVLFAINTALGHLWQTLTPIHAVIGHSQGEIAAAYLTGALTLQDAAAVVARRAQTLTTLAGTGTMLSIPQPHDTIALPPNTTIAAINGPATTIVSGPVPELDALLETYPASRRINVDYPSHSPHIEPLQHEILTQLAHITPTTGHTTFYSTMTGQPLDTSALTNDYWYQNLRRPVRLQATIEQLHTDGYRTFIEASPHPILTNPIHDTLTDKPHTALGTLRRNQGTWHTIHTNTTTAWHHGLTIEWPTTPNTTTPLPTYPFQRQPYWLRSTPKTDAQHLGLTATKHPLVPTAVQAADSDTLILTGRLDPAVQTWLADHAIHGTVVLPGAAILDLALHAGTHVDAAGVEELTLHSPLTIAKPTQLQVTVTGSEIAVHSRTETTDGQEAEAWTRHATATVATEAALPRPPSAQWPPVGATPVDLDDFYEGLADKGYEYGPVFACLSAAWRLGEDVYAEIQLPDGVDPAGHAIHPALLDGALHALAISGQLAAGDRLQLPFAFTGVTVHGPAGTGARVRVTPAGPDAATLVLTDPSGAALATIDRLTTRAIAPDQLGAGRDVARALHAVSWVPIAASPAEAPAATITTIAGDPADDVPAATHLLTAQALSVLRDGLAAPDRRLAIVTRGAVDCGGEVTDLPAAAVWGLVRSAQTEHPDRITLVDTDDTLPVEAALATGEPQLAIREGRLYAPRLERIEQPPLAPLDIVGPVLITGGTGTLGVLLAEHLATNHGVHDIVLASRSGTPAGGGFTTVAGDAGDPEQLRALLAERDFATVIHAAGVLADAVVETLTSDQLQAVLRPKVDAAWHLSRLLPAQTRLVLYSSATGVLGSPGQANYAAANTFLDALAQRRPNTISIAWGLWASASGLTGGMSDVDRNRLRGIGLAPITSGEGLALFDAALGTGRANVVASRLDTAALRGASVPAVLRGLVRTRPGAAPGSAGWLRHLAGLPADDRRRALLDLVRVQASAVLGHGTAAGVDVDSTFKDLGFDSLTSLELRNRLRTATGLALPATLIFDYATTTALAGHLDDRLVDAPAPVVAAVAARPVDDDPIAIVGMACRYPGGVASPDRLWDLVSAGTDAIAGFPTNRGWDLDSLYHADPDHPGTAYVREGGFLHNADQFDADFFGISPREALAMDPQQRLLLETAWEALEHAGIDPTTVRGTSAGVFAGVMYGDYGGRLALHTPDGFEGQIGTGNYGSVASGRVSYVLGLEGPAVTVDTACSSSLVAMHLAAQSLRQGESSLALAGGVAVMATPSTFVEFSRQRGLAADGRCKPFAAAADGTSFAEGVGLLVLERLSDAQANGHQVLAVIRGSAINQDGASNGLTAPNGPSQERVIRQALANAGLTTADVDAVEAHGTGTTLGDPIEAQALANTYGRDRQTQPLLLGSIKSNIGHTQAAAGVAGVIKMVQAMRHGTLPQTLHVDAPSPHLDWDTSGLQLLTSPTPWPAVDRPRRAAISSFGISGTNAHLILEQPPTPVVAPVTPGLEVLDPPILWRLSAKTPEALRALARQLPLDANPHEVAASLNLRAAHPYRASIIGDDRHAALHALATGNEHPNLIYDGQPAPSNPGKTVLVLPGQGSQWPGMARDLYQTTPLIRDHLHACAEALKPHTGWDLIELLQQDEIPQTPDVIQPVLFAINTALGHLWQTLTPINAVIGHSQGEIAAAYLTGALTLQDAAAVVARRAQTLTTLAGTGTMLSIPQPHDTIALPPNTTIAAINGPATTIVSGPVPELDALLETYPGSRRINVDYPSHSPHIEPLQHEILTQLAAINPVTGHTVFYSTMTGQPLDTSALTNDYWYQNLRRPVRLQATIEQLHADGYRTFIEASPHPILTNPIHDTLTDKPHTTLHTLRRNHGTWHTIYANTAAAWHHGLTITWPDTPRDTTPIPTYPFQRQPYWLHTPAGTAGNPRHLGQTATNHPLLPTAIQTADGQHHIYTGRLDPAVHTWLADHTVHGTVILPGTAILDLALHAGAAGIDELTLQAPLTITGPTQIQVTVTGTEIAVHSRSEATDGPEPGSWVQNATGTLATSTTSPPAGPAEWPPAGATPVPFEGAYDTLADAGYEYGPVFQGLRGLWRRGAEVFAEVAIDADRAGYVVHPALLDAALHPLLLGALGAQEPNLLPFSWTGVTSYATGGTDRLRVRLSADRAASLRLSATDADGRPVLMVESLALRAVAPESLARHGERQLYGVDWTPVPPQPALSPAEFAVVGPDELGVGDALAAAGHGIVRLADLADAPESWPADVLLPCAAADVRATLTWLLKLLNDERLAERRVTVVTRGGVSTGGGDPAEEPAAAAAWGFTRSAQTEHPGRFVLLDLDRAGDLEADAAAVPAALATGEPQVAVRAGRILAPRLARLETTAPAADPAIDPRGTVLITGATGLIGAAIARDLTANHGVRHLLLVSRSGAAAAGAAELTADLTALGATATVAAVDAADRAAMAALLAAVPAEHPLVGVVHAAGALDDAPLHALRPEQLDAVLRPKVDAALVLDELTAELPLSMFVLFSSLAGHIGSAGQANYAAANTAVDAIARRRRMSGRAGTSVAWGWWAEGSGLTGGLEDRDRLRMRRAGLAPMTTAAGISLFHAARGSSAPVVVAAGFDLPGLRSGYDTVSPLLRGLVRVSARAANGSLDRRLAGLTAQEQLELVLTTVRGTTATVLGHAGADTIDADRPFQELGFDSLTAVELRNRLNTTTGLRLPATLIFDHPTPRQAAQFVHQTLTNAAAPSAPATTAAPAADEPVAIVGMACRYPGGVADPDGLWNMVAAGADAISGFPTNRGWDLERLYHADPDHPGTAYVREGGFLHDADRFDADFFGISPREALATDPQQRLLLETAWESLEDAGIDPATLRGSSTGVFTGIMYGDYGGRLMSHAPDGFEGYLSTGSAASVASGRLSYTYGFEGPAVSVDTACSSSLVAMHLAAQSLRQGECDLALAGGVTVMATPGVFIEFSRQRGLSPQARCKSFAADADGAIWSEGVGLLVLERLSDAEANGHQVLAVIRGSAVNQDGASNGLTAPNGPSQERVIRQALASSGLTTADVDAVEAHGTGTALGDPIEAQALANTYGRDRQTQPLLLGSIKSNIGHTQAAAGVAGVIKMVQAMRHGTLPQTLHVDAPSPHLDWDTSGLQLLTSPTPWPAVDRPRRAAISSFGISGTNAHLILEQPPTPVVAPVTPGLEVLDPPILWRLSAKTPEALRAYATQLQQVDANPHEVAASLNLRTAHPYRASIIGDNFHAALHALATGEEHPNLIHDGQAAPSNPGKTVLVLPGQGSQWPGMARDLYQTTPLIRDHLHACAEALKPHTGWDLIELLQQDDIPQTPDVIQPVLFAINTALGHLWQTLTPIHAVIGHSQGEIAAAYLTGALTLTDAATIVARRAQTLTTLAGTGTMLSIPQPHTAITLPPDATIAAINGPATTIISGPIDTLETLLHEYPGSRRINVDYPSHSPHIEPLQHEILTQLAHITPSTGHTVFYSTVTGQPTDTTTLMNDYWYQNLRRPVRLQATIEQLHADGYRTFIEASPHPILTNPIHDTLTDKPHTVLGTLRRNQGTWHTIHTNTTTAWHHGVDITWPAAPTDTTSLPTYPFQRQSYWLHSVSRTNAHDLGLTATNHPLAPSAIETPATNSTTLTGRLDPSIQTWLADHTVHGTVVLPGTAILDLALHAAETHAEVAGIEELTLQAPLTITGPTQIQVTVTGTEIAVHSRAETPGDDEPRPWTRHATATLATGATPAPPTAPAWPPTGATPIDVDDFYDTLADIGLGYGPAFQGVVTAWRHGGDIYADLALPDTVDPAGHTVHPALLDAALQASMLGSLTPDSPARLPFVLAGVARHGAADSRLRAHVHTVDGDSFALEVSDDRGAPVLTIASVTARPVATELFRADAPEEGLFTLEWTTVPAPAAPAAPAEVLIIAASAAQAADVPAETHRLAEETLRLLQDALRGEAPIAVVTRGAVPIGDITDLAAAAVWGLVRSAQTEHPGRITVVDTDDTLALETALTTGEPQIAIREGKLYVPRLTRRTATQTAPAFVGPVLITGGTGTLGRLLAEHLATEHGIHDITLASRTAGPPAVSCDTSDIEQLRKLLAEHHFGTVIHAAGVLADATVDALTTEQLHTVLRPKVDAAWNLHRLLPPTTRLVLYSSAAGILGTAGQANYAAANAFLDALAHLRPNTTSVAWGLWAQTSELTKQLDPTGHRRLARIGIRPLDTGHAHRLLDAAVAGGHPLHLAADIDPRTLRTQDHFAVVLQKLAPSRKRRTSSQPMAARLAGLEGPALGEALLDLVRAQTATVLGHTDGRAITDERGFLDLGLDSLTAVELRNRLATATGLRLPATLVFDYPTPNTLATFLGSRLSSDGSESALAQLDQLAARFSTFPAETRAELRGRLQDLLSRLGDALPDGGAPERTEFSSDDDIFDFIDNDLQVSKMEEE